jgi:hypothetical protein
MVTVVVAHYRENLDWLSEFPKDWVHVYTKGHREIHVPYKKNYIQNVGREGHTYLHYICSHYDNLPDIVGFSQGSDDHMPARIMIHRINTMGSNTISGEISYRYSLDDLGIEDDGHVAYYKGAVGRSPYTFREWFTIFIKPIQLPLQIIFCACFAVRKEAILSRPKTFYEMLLKQLSTDINPEIGYYIERAWIYIFNCELEIVENNQ